MVVLGQAWRLPAVCCSCPVDGLRDLACKIKCKCLANTGQREGVEIDSKIHRFGGGPCSSWFKGVLEVKKGTPKEVRGACLLRVANQGAHGRANRQAFVRIHICRVDKESLEVVKLILLQPLENGWK